MAALPAIDEAEREQIRVALRRYKELHRIGDTHLWKRIGRQLGASGTPFTLSTLQRFIRGTHHTDDSVVAQFQDFLMQVAPPPPVAGVAAALAKFMPIAPADQESCGKLAGVYQTRGWRYESRPLQDWPERLWPQLGQIGLFITPDAAPPHWTDLRPSTIALGPEAAPGILYVAEIHLTPLSDEERRTGDGQIRLGGSGIMLPFGGRSYLMLMSNVREAYLYLLSKTIDEQPTLRGTRYAMTAAHNPKPNVAPGVWRAVHDIELMAMGVDLSSMQES